MDKHRLILFFVNYVEYLLNFLIARSRKFRQWHAVIAKPKLSGFIAFGSCLFGFASKINYRSNSDLFQRLHATEFWLRPTIKLTVDLVEVRQLRILSCLLRQRRQREGNYQPASRQIDFRSPVFHARNSKSIIFGR